MHKTIFPDILFLSETKNPDDYVSKTLDWMNFPSKHLVSPHCPGGGGLALFWKHEIHLEIVSSCKTFIDTVIKYKHNTFCATFIYGEPDQSKRKDIWDKLADISKDREAPWFLTGDFNEILDSSEKRGGPQRAEGSFSAFHSFLSGSDLFDLRHSGNPLSWRGKRHNHLVHCRLDRSISNSLWAEMFPSGRCSYLKFEGSDHRPLISYFEPPAKKKRGIFRYDRRMSNNEEITKLVSDIWAGTTRDTVEQKICACRKAISKWNKDHHSNSQKSIEASKEKLDEVMGSATPNDQLMEEVNATLKKAYKEEEEYWRQRSRNLWEIRTQVTSMPLRGEEE